MRTNQLQGTEQWFEDRRGKITSSKIKTLLIAKGLGAGAETYATEIATEIVTGKVKEGYSGSATDHGTDTEPLAIQHYEAKTWNLVTDVGFIPHPTLGKYYGGSADGKIDEGKGIIEVKCPYNPAVHFNYLSDGVVPKEHIPQIQSNLFVTGAEYCDFISFNKDFPGDRVMMIVRMYRDEKMISLIEERVMLMISKINKKVNNFKK